MWGIVGRADKRVFLLRVYGWPRAVVVAVKASQGKTFLKNPEYYMDQYPFWDAVAWAVQAVDTPCSERQGYESVLEHVVIQFLAKCSRICTHELVRHRLASYAQTSTRILGLEAFRSDDKSSGTLYKLVVQASMGNSEALETLCVIPTVYADDVKRACIEYFRRIVESQGRGVDQWLRYSQPDALAAHIMVTTNLREVLHMASLRLHPHAHWEIKGLFEEVAERLWVEHKIPFHLMLALKRPGLARLRRDIVEEASRQLEVIVANIGKEHAKKLDIQLQKLVQGSC